MTLWVVGGEAEFLVEGADDLCEVGGHTQKGSDIVQAFLKKVFEIRIHGFRHTVEPYISEMVHAVLFVDSTSDVLHQNSPNLLCGITRIRGQNTILSELVGVDTLWFGY